MTLASPRAMRRPELTVSDVMTTALNETIEENGTLVGTQTDYLDLARKSLLGLPLER